MGVSGNDLQLCVWGLGLNQGLKQCGFAVEPQLYTALSSASQGVLPKICTGAYTQHAYPFISTEMADYFIFTRDV